MEKDGPSTYPLNWKEATRKSCDLPCTSIIFLTSHILWKKKIIPHMEEEAHRARPWLCSRKGQEAERGLSTPGFFRSLRNNRHPSRLEIHSKWRAVFMCNWFPSPAVHASWKSKVMWQPLSSKYSNCLVWRSWWLPPLLAFVSWSLWLQQTSPISAVCTLHYARESGLPLLSKTLISEARL